MAQNILKVREYAIVDIETTGGDAGSSRITEIAIRIYRDFQIIDSWESLVNPGIPIPAQIFALTGIDNDLVENAPFFEDIAETVYLLLKDRVFVAHNVNFDYSFLFKQLKDAGFLLQTKKLCTIRYARKVFPDLSSYSLGKLCKQLNIPLFNAHRAGGDADATILLFEKLLKTDTEHTYLQTFFENPVEQRIPINLKVEDLESLPMTTGVYYFHDAQHKVIYVGKAKSIYKRVVSHFSGNSSSLRRQQFLKEIFYVTYQECSTELMAMIVECNEILKLWPKYNYALKKYEPKYGLLSYEGQNGFNYLAITKVQKSQNYHMHYDYLMEGVNYLKNIAQEFQIDYAYCKFGENSNSTILQSLEKSSHIRNLHEHNETVNLLLEELKKRCKSYYILDKGRNDEEKLCIWVNKGDFYGMGYVDYNVPIENERELKNCLTRYKSNYYINRLIEKFKEMHPSQVYPIEEADLNEIMIEDYQLNFK